MSTFAYLRISFITVLLFMMNSVNAGSFTAPERHSNLNIYIGYAAEDRVAIMDGSTNDRRLRGGHSLKDTSTYHTAVFGIGYWFPLYDRSGYHFNGVAYFDHIPGPTVDVYNTQTGSEPAWAELKTHRTNFGLGINVIVPYLDDMYFLGMISGGVSRRHVHASFNDMNTGGGSGPFDSSESHGFTSNQPFIGGEIGLGKNLSHGSTVYAFLSANASRKDNPYIHGGGADSNSAAFLRVPNHWWKIGVALTREINIL